ncbi:Ig kappa chain V region GOM [Chelonia mydas]|uniref:Ig kappa chain V region GOM n=1 Tax=Chelonia mydas TaxID=8469 RepID=M7BWN4_CHEMY|nr:Ig kappa chain V region GOM [Chelonia mydas]
MRSTGCRAVRVDVALVACQGAEERVSDSSSEVSKDDAAVGVYQTPLCISAAVGMEPIMECRFPPMETSEIVYISWYKEGETLNSSDSHLLRSENLTAGSGTLKISRVQAQDAGVYVCEMGNITHSSTGNGTKLEVHVATSVGINILLLRNIVGGQLLLTLMLAVIIEHFMSGAFRISVPSMQRSIFIRVSVERNLEHCLLGMVVSAGCNSKLKHYANKLPPSGFYQVANVALLLGQLRACP